MLDVMCGMVERVKIYVIYVILWSDVKWCGVKYFGIC